MVDKSIKDKVVYIKLLKEKYGLSCERICEIVSYNGEYVSVSTVRRLTAPNAEIKRFRDETITPVYNALLNTYGDGSPTPAAVDPAFYYPHYDRYQYEKLAAILKESNERLRSENEEQKELIEKQSKMIDILWHGLLNFGKSKEEFAAVVEYYMKQLKKGGDKNG